jgi:hypothetical protein
MTAPFRIMPRLALIAAAAFITGGYTQCSFSSGTGGTGSVGGTSFDTTLTLHSASGGPVSDLVMGEPIRFDLEIRNQSGQTADLDFRDAQIYDFYVLDAAGARVRWRWSEGQVFSQVATRLSIAPYSSRSYSVEWNGVLADGTQLPAGNYRARGVVVADGFPADPLASGDLGSNLVDFSVH